jgi:adenosylmethionine-8-amino-7-oxononanoate aminotransferase
MSLQYWLQTGKAKKQKMVYLQGAYHGETLGALSVCGIDMFRDKFENALMENIAVEGPDCYRCPYGLSPDSCDAECFAPMQTTLDEQQDSIAAVIVEPLVQGAAGMKMYPPVYLNKLQQACEVFNIHTIYDEVAVGFGRTGSLFVSASHGLKPTFLCLSKGITSGYLPLAATLVDEKIYQAFYDDFKTLKFFIHSHSYSANPLACACANESLRLLTEDNFLQTLKPKIELMQTCGENFSDLKVCGEYRQTGMIGAVELVQDKTTKKSFPFEQRLGYQIYLEGLKRGVFMRPLGNVVYFIPPLIISPDEIQFMMDTALECIRAVCES